MAGKKGLSSLFIAVVTILQTLGAVASPAPPAWAIRLRETFNAVRNGSLGVFNGSYGIIYRNSTDYDSAILKEISEWLKDVNLTSPNNTVPFIRYASEE
jgi:hypothetical protein